MNAPTRLYGLAGLRLALLEDFERGLAPRLDSIAQAACRYRQSGGIPGRRFTLRMRDRVDELLTEARRLWCFLLPWSEWRIVPDLDLECPCCLLVAAVLDVCAAQDAGNAEDARRHTKRLLSAAVVLAETMEGIDDARC